LRKQRNGDDDDADDDDGDEAQHEHVETNIQIELKENKKLLLFAGRVRPSSSLLRLDLLFRVAEHSFHYRTNDEPGKCAFETLLIIIIIIVKIVALLVVVWCSCNA
jgi:hypothetical protein